MIDDFYDISPVADPASSFTAGCYRVTTLTSRLIRLEFNRSEHFQDLPTLTFTVRKQPVPATEVTRSDDHLEVKTSHLCVSIRGFAEPPTSDSVRIWSLRGEFEWKYGDRESQNLLGTTRTLDEIDGACSLSPGLCSRDGYAVVDDSRAPTIGPGGLFSPNDSEVDLYFFGYCHDYTACIADFLLVSGRPPLLPR
jgi:hypothetical protein